MHHDAASEGRPTLDELRRRLYDSAATADDLARYRAAAEAEAAPSAPEPASPRRGPLWAGAVLALVTIAALALTLLPHAAPAPAATPSASPSGLRVDDPTRIGFVENLAGGGAAGIAAYLVTNPPPLPLRSAARAETIERHGTGPGILTLIPASEDTVAGRATVLLVLGASARVTWITYRRTTDEGDARLVRQTVRGGDQQAGVPTTVTFAYGRGDRPVRLRIDVPAGVRWGAAVVLTD